MATWGYVENLPGSVVATLALIVVVVLLWAWNAYTWRRIYAVKKTEKDESTSSVLDIPSEKSCRNIPDNEINRPRASHDDLSRETIFTGKTLALHDLPMIRSHKGCVIKGITFDDCIIYGPAMIKTIEGCFFSECDFGIPVDPKGYDALRLNVPKSKKWLVGIFYLDRCVFKNCSFRFIGFADRKENLDEFFQEITKPS